MAFTPFFERKTTLLVLHRTTLCPILTFFNLDVIKKFFASFESGLAVFFISIGNTVPFCSIKRSISILSLSRYSMD